MHSESHVKHIAVAQGYQQAAVEKDGVDRIVETNLRDLALSLLRNWST